MVVFSTRTTVASNRNDNAANNRARPVRVCD